MNSSLALATQSTGVTLNLRPSIAGSRRSFSTSHTRRWELCADSGEP